MLFWLRSKDAASFCRARRLVEEPWAQEPPRPQPSLCKREAPIWRALSQLAARRVVSCPSTTDAPRQVAALLMQRGSMLHSAGASLGSGSPCLHTDTLAQMYQPGLQRNTSATAVLSLQGGRSDRRSCSPLGYQWQSLDYHVTSLPSRAALETLNLSDAAEGVAMG